MIEMPRKPYQRSACHEQHGAAEEGARARQVAGTLVAEAANKMRPMIRAVACGIKRARVALTVTSNFCSIWNSF